MGSGGGSSPVPSASPDETKQKWGILGKIPLLPRVFSDVYSFASAPFDMGEGQANTGYEGYGNGELGVGDGDTGRVKKGVVGWSGDHSLLVVGAGVDGKWEKFVIAEGEDGKRYCIRDGWKRYLGSG